MPRRSAAQRQRNVQLFKGVGAVEESWQLVAAGVAAFFHADKGDRVHAHVLRGDGMAHVRAFVDDDGAGLAYGG